MSSGVTELLALFLKREREGGSITEPLALFLKREREGGSVTEPLALFLQVSQNCNKQCQS